MSYFVASENTERIDFYPKQAIYAICPLFEFVRKNEIFKKMKYKKDNRKRRDWLSDPTG